MESPPPLPLAQLEAQAVRGLEDAGEALDRVNVHVLAFVRERPHLPQRALDATHMMDGKS